jgi:chromosome segregation ATPase
MERHAMAQEVLIPTLSERLRELERARSAAARLLEQANTQIDEATRAIETAVAQEKTAHESTQQVNAELNELRRHIYDLLTRNENQSSEEHVRLSEEVDVLHTHIESLRGI